MTGMILDAVLMLLLVAALGYGMRLERKLKALREGQLAFASAVTELNAAAGRAENALASLKSSGQDTDLLHDRIVKARELKQHLEVLLARADDLPKASPRPATHAKTSPNPMTSIEDERALRMAVLADRIQGRTESRGRSEGKEFGALGASSRVAPVHHEPKPNLNRVRRMQDDDLFAA